jgi:hypothetical protein
MNTKNLKTAIVMTVLVLTGLNVNAQVTIGSFNDPQKGVLLELKTKEANNPNKVTDDENVTVDATGGGLLFPRVKLVNKATLDPFINSKNNQEWTANVKLTHAGMVVYNLTVSDGFQLGLYVWNGSEWTLLNGEDSSGKERYFPIPSFNIELKGVDVPNEVNFYEAYKKQYDLANNSLMVSSNLSLTSPNGHLYQADELDYVITYYDPNVIEIESLNAAGLMKFKTKSLDLDANSFINVIAVVK